jgi:hypothetical protein
MTNKNDGGPAFPAPIIGVDGHEGMTLRDYFAAKALRGTFYPAILNSLNSGDDLDCLKLAKMTYVMADAMLEARK